MAIPKFLLTNSRWNIANLVTFSRILVTPIFLVLIFRPELWAKWAAGLLFAWGGLSDYFDGYLARKYNLKTDFGTLMDPLADKILFVSVFLAFVQLQLVPAWMVVVILARESLITWFRQVAQSRNVVIAAGSVVRGEIPDRCVVAGVPARIIREHTDAGWLSPRAPA